MGSMKKMIFWKMCTTLDAFQFLMNPFFVYVFATVLTVKQIIKLGLYSNECAYVNMT